MPTQTETIITVKSKADGNIGSPYDRMGRAAAAAAQQEAKYQSALEKTTQAMKQRGSIAHGGSSSKARQYFGGVGGGAVGGMIGGPGGSFIGSQVASGMGGAAAALGVGVAAYAAMTAAAGKAADAINIMNNGALNAAQKQDQFVKMIPGGETWLKLRDAITGVTESLRKLSISQAESMLAQSNAHEKAMAQSSGNAEVARAKNRARAFGNATVPDTLTKLAGGRDTYKGELAYQEAATKFPAQVALSRAQAEQSAAERDLKASKARRVTLEGNRVRLTDRMDKAMAAQKQARANGNAFGANAGENRVDMVRAGLKSQQAIEAVLLNERRIQAEINKQREYGVTLAQKESEVRKASLNLSKAKMQSLQGKEQRQSSTAKALGAMNPAQRAMALQAVKMAQKTGDIGKMPPMMAGLVRQVLPGFADKLMEKSGEKTSEYKEFQRLGLVDEGSLAQTRQEQAKTAITTEVSVNLDEQALANKIGEVLGKTLDAFVKSIEAQAKASGAKLRSGIQLQNASK